MNEKVTTRAVYDIETAALLEQESQPYRGPWALAGPPTAKWDEDSLWFGATYVPGVVGGIIATAALAATLVTAALAAQVGKQPQDEITTVTCGTPAFQSNAFQNNAFQVCVALKPDEDFWVNPVAPLQATLSQRLPLGDPEELPAGSLFGQPDEDFWSNPVAPVQASLYQRLPYLADPEELVVAPPSSFQPDEDYYLPAPPTFRSDRNFGGQALQSLGVGGDPEEIPAESLFGQPDEDGYIPTFTLQRSPVATVGGLYLPDPDQGGVFPAAAGQPDEDFWVAQATVPPVQLSFFRSYGFGLDPDEIPVAAATQADEDFWSNPVAPVQASFFQPLPYNFDAGEIVPQPAAVIAEEDYPSSRVGGIRVPPAGGTLYQPLPYLPDPEEIPAGSLRGQPDEDFWPNPAAPVAPAYAGFFRSYGLGLDPDEIPAGNLFGQADEDGYIPRPPLLRQDFGGLALQSPWGVGGLPYSYDSAEIVPTSVGTIADEDYWFNPLPIQSAGTLRIPHAGVGGPYFFDLLESLQFKVLRAHAFLKLNIGRSFKDRPTVRAFKVPNIQRTFKAGAMSVGTITKQPFEVLNSSVDFVDIMPSGDTLTLISVTATKGGASTTASVIATSPAPAVAGSKVTFQVIDGADGERHTIEVKVSDSSGEKYEAEVDLLIVEQ